MNLLYHWRSETGLFWFSNLIGMNYSSQLTFAPTLIYFFPASGFLNYICILRISFYPFLACFANTFVWALNLNHCSWTSVGMPVFCVLVNTYAWLYKCLWVCYLNNHLAMLVCSFDTLKKPSTNSLHVHDSPLLHRWHIAPRVCCQSDCPSLRCRKGTILVWNVLDPPRWIWLGSRHRKFLQLHTHKRFVYFCTESLLLYFFSLTLLLYVLWISHRMIWQALENCCLDKVLGGTQKMMAGMGSTNR